MIPRRLPPPVRPQPPNRPIRAGPPLGPSALGLLREGADRWEAQDAVAEAIRDALRRWPELTHPVAWARTAARSHWLEQRRSAGRGDVEVLMADIGELRASRADPEPVAYELQEWFAGVLAKLPPARR